MSNQSTMRKLARLKVLEACRIGRCSIKHVGYMLTVLTGMTHLQPLQTINCYQKHNSWNLQRLLFQPCYWIYTVFSLPLQTVCIDFLRVALTVLKWQVLCIDFCQDFHSESCCNVFFLWQNESLMQRTWGDLGHLHTSDSVVQRTNFPLYARALEDHILRLRSLEWHSCGYGGVYTEVGRHQVCGICFFLC